MSDVGIQVLGTSKLINFGAFHLLSGLGKTSVFPLSIYSISGGLKFLFQS